MGATLNPIGLLVPCLKISWRAIRNRCEWGGRSSSLSLEGRNCVYPTCVADAKAFDAHPHKFAQGCFKHGLKQHTTVHAVLAAQRRCSFRRWQLRHSRRYVWRWKYSRPVHSRPPIPHKVWQPLVGVTLGQGGSDAVAFGTQYTLRDNCLILEWFLGSSSPEEMIALTRTTILLAVGFLDENLWTVAIISDAKTRRAFCFTQFSLVECPRLATSLLWFLEGKVPITPLFGRPAIKLTQILGENLSLLGIPADQYTLSCFRARGAIHQYRVEWNLDILQVVWRWKAPATLHHYIQSAISPIQLAAVPVKVRPRGEALASFFDGATPP